MLLRFVVLAYSEECYLGVCLESILAQTHGRHPPHRDRGGFAFDTVTQMYATGYLNNPNLVNPPGLFRPLRTDERPLWRMGVQISFASP